LNPNGVLTRSRVQVQPLPPLSESLKITATTNPWTMPILYISPSVNRRHKILLMKEQRCQSWRRLWLLVS